MHWLANPVPGVGIAVPVFVPALVTAVVALLLSREGRGAARLYRRQHGHADRRRSHQPGQVGGLGAPIASIGGAGTFDGIFLTGILAVLLAGLYRPAPPVVQPWA